MSCLAALSILALSEMLQPAVEEKQANIPLHSSELRQYPDLSRVVSVLGRRPFQHSHEIRSIAFADDGRTLLTTSRHGLRAWDITERKLLREMEFEGPNTLYLSANRSATRIAVCGDWGTPKVIEWPSGKVALSIPNAREYLAADGRVLVASLTTIALSPDGKKLAASYQQSGNHGFLRIWDGETGVLLGERNGPLMHALAWAPDSRFIAVGERRGIVIFLEPGGELIRPGIRLQHADPPCGLAFDAAGKHVAVLTLQGSAGVWTVSGRKPVWYRASPYAGQHLMLRGTAGGIVFDRRGQRLFANSGRSDLTVFKAATGEIEVQESRSFSSLSNVALSSDGETIAIGTEAYAVGLWNTRSLKPSIADEHQGFHSARLVRPSPDGKRC